jgi:hypothetical protein
MSDDLIDRLQNPHFDDLQWPKGLFAEAADRIETLEAALRVAAGYISTKEGHTDQHPQDVYDWIVRAALAGKKKDE